MSNASVGLGLSDLKRGEEVGRNVLPVGSCEGLRFVNVRCCIFVAGVVAADDISVTSSKAAVRFGDLIGSKISNKCDSFV